MQNAQSYEAIQRHVRRLTLLHQVSVDVALAQTAPQLHQQIVRAALLLVEADASGLLLYDQVNHLIITAARRSSAVPVGPQPSRLGAASTVERRSCASCSTLTDYARFRRSPAHR